MFVFLVFVIYNKLQNLSECHQKLNADNVDFRLQQLQTSDKRLQYQQTTATSKVTTTIDGPKIAKKQQKKTTERPKKQSH